MQPQRDLALTNENPPLEQKVVPTTVTASTKIVLNIGAAGTYNTNAMDTANDSQESSGSFADLEDSEEELTEPAE